MDDKQIRYIQNLIDRLVYLEENDKEDFIKKLNELYLMHPIQQKVIWGAESYQTLTNEHNNTINLSDDDREHGNELS